MSSEIPLDVAKAIHRLRSEAREKNRLADELHRVYTGRDPQQITFDDRENSFGIGPKVPSVVTAELIVEFLRENDKKAARLNELARFFNVPVAHIKTVVESSNGKLFIPDWRGWVKPSKHK